MAKIKPEEESKLQVAGQKKSKLQLSIPAIKMPHDRLVEGLFVVEPPAEVRSADEDTPLTPPNATQFTHPTQLTPLTPDNAPHVTQPTPAPLTPPTPATVSPAAPMRDYHKMDNSVTRGIPEYFRNGKLKLIYDVLYQRSRGAFPASHTVQIARSEIMRLAGVGSMNTIDKAMKRLAEVGLVTQTFILGDRSGNVYEVRTPGELGYSADLTQPTPPTPPNVTYPTPLSSAQKLDDVRHAESALSGDSPNPIDTGTSDTSKTLFKDFLNLDDETGLKTALKRFAAMSREATGREATQADWNGLVDILNMVFDEAAIATSRASTVTCFGRLAAENLRRRLQSKGKQGKKAELFDPGREPVLDEAAVEVIDPVPEPLGARREMHLQSLRDVLENSGEANLEHYRPTYTEEDWTWLMERLVPGK